MEAHYGAIYLDQFHLQERQRCSATQHSSRSTATLAICGSCAQRPAGGLIRNVRCSTNSRVLVRWAPIPPCEKSNWSGMRCGRSGMLIRGKALPDILHGVAVLLRQFARVGVEVDVPGTLWDLLDSREALSGRLNRRRRDLVGGSAAFGGVFLPAIPFPALFVRDLHAVHFAARPFLELSHLPVLHVARDVDSLDLGVDRTAAAGALLEVVRDVHLVGSALVFGLSRAIAVFVRCGFHRSVSPVLIEVRCGPDLLRAAIDLVGGLAKLLLADLPERLHVLAELRLPGWSMCERDQVPGPLVQLRQARP